MSDPVNLEEAIRQHHDVNVDFDAETVIKLVLTSGEQVTLQVHHLGTDYVCGNEVAMSINGAPVDLASHDAGRYVKFDAIATAQCFAIKNGDNLNFK